MENKEILIIVLDWDVKIFTAFIKDNDVPELEYNKEEYHPVDSEDWTGFYDFLRNDKGIIIGIRYWPDEEAMFICDLIRHLPYAKVSEKKEWIEFYFTTDRDYISALSTDQQFTGNWILKSRSGKYAITFRIDILIDTEKQRILSFLSNRAKLPVS